jgi:hypothetical protein
VEGVEVAEEAWIGDDAGGRQGWPHRRGRGLRRSPASGRSATGCRPILPPATLLLGAAAKPWMDRSSIADL